MSPPTRDPSFLGKLLKSLMRDRASPFKCSNGAPIFYATVPYGSKKIQSLPSFMDAAANIRALALMSIDLAT